MASTKDPRPSTHQVTADPAAPRPEVTTAQRPPAEVVHAAELDALAARDERLGRTRPPGWSLSAQAVVEFVLGDEQAGTAPKFVGSRAFVERCVVALATNRGLMLIGEPGTAKSYLSELLAAAVSHDTSLTIQGSASTTFDAMAYSWNYALLLGEGPTARSLVPGPLHRGMTLGRTVRFEEITRCPVEIQDAMLSILSDRVLVVGELEDEAERSVFAQPGFNVIATANTRDRGVNEMSAALKRRFNFETVPAIKDARTEMDLVRRQTDALLERAEVPVRLPVDVTEVLVQTFRELRTGQAAGDRGVERLTTVMSTAEAVSVGVAASLQSAWFGDGTPGGRELVSGLLGTALKDDPEDRSRLRGYLERHVKGRKGIWQQMYAARDLID